WCPSRRRSPGCAAPAQTPGPRRGPGSAREGFREWPGRSWLAPDQRDHFEVRRASLAGHGLAGQQLEAGLVDEAPQLLVGEPQVDVPVGLDRGAMAVPG